MNTYNGYSARNSFMAAAFTILFSAACLAGALGPASNVQPNQPMTIVSQA